MLFSGLPRGTPGCRHGRRILSYRLDTTCLPTHPKGLASTSCANIIACGNVSPPGPAPAQHVCHSRVSGFLFSLRALENTVPRAAIVQRRYLYWPPPRVCRSKRVKVNGDVPVGSLALLDKASGIQSGDSNPCASDFVQLPSGKKCFVFNAKRDQEGDLEPVVCFVDKQDNLLMWFNEEEILEFEKLIPRLESYYALWKAKASDTRTRSGIAAEAVTDLPSVGFD
ncbi:hypothetical protein CSUI_003535 [Cystoisospora suis]|uniref:Uncharacterized protein n=1 Tax=Cystoisospora suis TaxID=483139 RepID=A0A2C6L4H8_9APIC|nr:hypothetical protein CSUI_003535 [Cystoisospora suis]